MYSARVLANAFLWKKKDEAQLTHMKLQKLVFFTYAWWLALHDQPIVQEAPKAWQYGPVFTSIYHELKAYGSSPVREMLRELDPKDGQFKHLIPSLEHKEFWGLFDRVWERYGKYTAAQLSALSHEAGGPWDRARREGWDAIPLEWIREHYRNKLVHGPSAAATS